MADRGTRGRDEEEAKEGLSLLSALKGVDDPFSSFPSVAELEMVVPLLSDEEDVACTDMVIVCLNTASILVGLNLLRRDKNVAEVPTNDDGVGAVGVAAVALFASPRDDEDEEEGCSAFWPK